MKRSTADGAHTARKRKRNLLSRAPKLSPDKTAALLFCGALLSLVVAMFPPGVETPTPAQPPLVETGREEPRPAQATESVEEAPVLESAGDAPPPNRKSADPFLAEVRRRAMENPEEALLWLRDSVAGPRRLQGMLEVVALWGSQDSENALLWLESNAEGLARMETLQAGVRLWSEGDPTAAAEWIQGMANDGSKQAAAEALTGTWARKDPRSAADWVQTLDAGPVRAAAAEALVESWSERTPSDAALWARNEARQTGNPELLYDAVEQFSAFDPMGALAFVRGLTPGEETANAARAYVRSGAREFPADTAAWIATLPPEDPLFLDSHAEDLMSEWASTDSVAASAWLESQPDGRLREAATAAFTDAILPYEPEAAAAWSNTLADPRQRIESLERSVGIWASRDPDAARTWIAEAELEPQLRMHLADLLPSIP